MYSSIAEGEGEPERDDRQKMLSVLLGGDNIYTEQDGMDHK